MDKQNNKKTNTIKSSRLRRGLKIAGIFLLFFVLLLGALRLPVVQKPLTGLVANALTRDLGLEVRVGGVDFNFINRLQIKDLLILYEQGDTLFYASQMHASTKKPLTSIVLRSLEVNEIALNGAELNLLIGPDRPDDIFSHLRKQSRKGDGPHPGFFRTLYFSLDAISGSNLKVFQQNLFEGVERKIELDKIFLSIDEIDLLNNRFHLNSLVLDQANAQFFNYGGVKSDAEEPPLFSGELGDGLFRPKVNIQLDYFEVRNSRFENLNTIGIPSPAYGFPHIDYGDFRLQEIELQWSGFSLDSTGVKATPQLLSLRVGDDIELTSIRADRFTFSDTGLELSNLQLLTEYSYLDDDISLKFSNLNDFNNFTDFVEIEAAFRRSEIKISELLYFLPELGKNDFFFSNAEALINLQGDFSGSVNNFRGDDINISIGSDLALRGSFSSRGLARPGEELIRLNLEGLETSMEALGKLIPDFQAPENFYKLGDLYFQGRFDGYFRDFVAEGSLQTNLGLIKTDMRLDVTRGADLASYSGTLRVSDFDLASWTENPDFGPLSFYAEVDEGMGLTSEFVHAHLVAEIESFSFRDYEYANLMMDGYIDQNVFDGYFSIEDENLDLELVGIVFYGEEQLRVNADVNLNHLNTRELRLSEREYIISAGIKANLNQIDLRYPIGYLGVEDLILEVPDTLHTYLDYFYVHADVFDDSVKQLTIQSDLLEFFIKGNYFWDELPHAFLPYLGENFSYLKTILGDSIETVSTESAFTFELDIFDSRAFEQLLFPSLDTVIDGRVWGEVNALTDFYKLEFSFPELKQGNNEFIQLYGLANFEGGFGNLMISADQLSVGGISGINPTTLFLDFNPDTVGFTINTADYGEVLDRLQMEGRIFMRDEYWAARISNTELTFFGDDWNVTSGNELVVGKNFFRTDNLFFSSGEKMVSVESINNRGVNLSMTGINISILDDLINDHRYNMYGEADIQLWVANIFEIDALNGQFFLDDFLFQDIEYGQLFLEAQLQTDNAPLELNLRTDHPERSMRGSGVVYLQPDIVPEGKKALDFHLDIKQFPMMIFEKIIENGVNGTVGVFDGSLSVTGNSGNDLRFDGNATVFNTATNIEILGVRYYVHDQNIGISSSLIDLSGLEIRDRFDNVATVSGGLTHRNFADLGMDLVISSDRILGHDTGREDSDLYFGRIIGQVEARFIGSFQRPDIRVSAINGPGSNFTVLVGENIESGDIDFITFEEDAVEGQREFFRDVTGVNFLLDISVTEDADVQMVFNEQTGDILRGRGNGNLQLSLTRNGDFNIFGDYNISQGNYLFANSFALLQINKPFDVLSGGTIQWTGDPFDALIDVRASYTGLNAAPFHFIEDYLQGGDGNETVRQGALQSTAVDLTMLLTGFLRNPEINFTIDFPNLTGQLKTLADRRILDLEENPDEMNRQVFALVVIGGFLPASLNLETSVAAITNTVNEWLSTQLSLYLSDLLSNAFEEVGFISGIEMDVGYVLPTGEFVEAGRIDTRQSEVRVGLRPSLFDDRVQLNVGGNYVRESFFTNDPYLAPYGIVEYFITPDRRWRLRLSTNYDYVVEGRRNRHSIGVSFRREFDSIDEFVHTIKLFERSEKRKRKPKGEGRIEEEEDILFD
ncbi:MAG: hypothetical protein EA409_03395 [Saprospirales bacterium]|nr:MAG: hypothetical protein EA409_03395 [Saprospirales bacterium]